MKLGMFLTQVEDAWKLLRMLGVADAREPRPQYESVRAAEFRDLRYRECWERTYAGRLYNFRLRDMALFQFKYARNGDQATPSYSYLQCPMVVQEYEEFLRDVLGEEAATVGDEFRDDWESSLDNAPLRDSPVYFRFDYAPKEYRAGVHPAAHMHFGHETGIRISTRRVLRPMSFVLFVIRHVYAARWEKLAADPGYLGRYIRQNLDDVPDDFWGPAERLAMWLE
ncbi:MAG: hypothetical protein HMLKMBBP_01239 [Planctomycetes bacterium]|nr:hypothetical protein [Planctomycetota bacterium]